MKIERLIKLKKLSILFKYF